MSWRFVRVVGVGLLLAGVSRAAPERDQIEGSAAGDQPMLRASPAPDLAELERWVRTYAPDIEAASLAVGLARSEVTKSRRLPNPSLDLGWGTLPLGQTNPVDLADPWANVPNYSAGVSYTPPIGKRKPLVRRTEALERAADRTLAAQVRERALAAAQVLGALATTRLRIDGLKELVETGQELTRVAEIRAAAQTIPGIDLDRARLEVGRLQQAVLVADAAQMAHLSRCAEIVGTQCEPFEDAQTARDFLDAWIARVPGGDDVARRPDLEALREYVSAASAEAKWASSLKIPDPTVRLGYVHDRFLIAGNQQNSLNLSVSIPLLVSDSGQAERQAAQSRSDHARAELAKREASAHTRLALLREVLAREKTVQEKLHAEILPNAQAVMLELSEAADRGLVPISEVIVARRVVDETLLDEVEGLGAAFSAAVEINAQLGPPTERTVTR